MAVRIDSVLAGPTITISLTFERLRFQYRTAHRIAQIPDPEGRRDALIDILDKSDFNWRVFFVAASGFLTDSYNLFSSNVILPSLAYVYLGEEDHSSTLIINALTLSGSACGMVSFGILADIFGRQRLYGVELVIVIFATLGLAASGPGFVTLPTGESAMSPLRWIMFWRFVMGVGIGAEYPLSACITIEWASKRYRAQMMAAVFMMQPVGQFLAYGIGLLVLHGLNSPPSRYNLTEPFRNATDSEIGHSKVGIDILWRIVAGVGGIPALLALIFRWTIPESPRYTYDIKQDSIRAAWDTATGTTGLFAGWSRSGFDDDDEEHAHVIEDGESDGVEMESLPRARDFAGASTGASGGSEQNNNRANTLNDGTNGATDARSTDSNAHGQPVVSALERSNELDYVVGLDDPHRKWTQFKRKDWSEYFHDGANGQGNWRNVFGVSVCWAALDFVFHGLGFNDPGTLARIWTANRADEHPQPPSWLLYSAVINDEDASIFSVLESNGINCLVTVSLWSLIGCALLTNRINFINRLFTIIWTSILLAALLLTTAIAFPYCFHKSGHSWLVVLYAAIQFWFSFGPNTLLFIIPAEIFPTRYRCTCYGIAAASGKIGAVLMRITYLRFDDKKLREPNSMSLGYLMYLFSGVMLVVALFAWLYIPEVQIQGSREEADTCIPSWWVENRTLEELAEGRASMTAADRIGFVERTTALRKRILRR